MLPSSPLPKGVLLDEVGLGKTIEATSSSRSAGPLAIAPDETIGIDAETVERLLSVPARTVDVPTVAVPEDRLADAEAARRRTLLDAAERQNEEWLEAESEKLDDYVDDLERAFEAEIKSGEAEIRGARKALRKAEYFDKRAKWCKAESEHAKHGGKPWSYLLIPVIQDNEILANAALDGLSARFARA